MEAKNALNNSGIPQKTISNYILGYYVVRGLPVVYDKDIGVYAYENNKWEGGPKDNLINEEGDKLDKGNFDKEFPNLLSSFENFKKETLFVSKYKSAVSKMLFPETYEHNFLHAIEKFSGKEQEDIKKALDIAKSAHKNQFRDEGLPYYVHCIAVAQDLINQGGSATDAIVCLLHDTLEDTKITYQEIEQNFGEDIAKSVLKLSKIRNGIKINISDYYKELSDDIVNLKRKGYDRVNNLLSLYYNPNQEKIKRYIKDTETVVFPLFEIKYPEIFSQMRDIIKFLDKKVPLNEIEKSKLDNIKNMNNLKKDI